MQQHRVFAFVGGDDWRLNIQLLNDEGKPYDLSALNEIKWLIHNSRGEIVEHTALQQITDSANGKLTIWIPHEETTKFPSDVYTDFVRINCDGIVSTLLTGPISVTADPWRAPIAEQLRATRSTANIVAVVGLSRQERIERRAAGPAEVIPLRKIAG